MLPEVLSETSEWRKLTDRDLPCGDGEPMDTPWHHYCMDLLIDCLKYHRRGRKDFYCGGDMILYFSEKHVFNKDFRGPDFFVVNDVDRERYRRSWVVWQEGDRFPDVIVELSSPTTADVDLGPKMELYRDRFRTAEYYVYDPDTDTFSGYQRRNGTVDPLEIEPGNRIWSRSLELYVGVWDGTYHDINARWVRFFDVHGNLIPTHLEAQTALTQVETQARSKAETLAKTEAQARIKAEAQAKTNAQARSEAESRANEATAELARLKQELAALRNAPPSA